MELLQSNTTDVDAGCQESWEKDGRCQGLGKPRSNIREKRVVGLKSVNKLVNKSSCVKCVCV